MSRNRYCPDYTIWKRDVEILYLILGLIIKGKLILSRIDTSKAVDQPYRKLLI
jgi:hypothetical protein